MKNLKVISFTLALFLMPAYAYSIGDLRISLLEGDVQIRTESTSEWVPASINTPLLDGDRLWVPEGGRVEIQLRDGTFLRLNENSSLAILALDNDSSQFYLAEGNAYVNFRGLRDNLIQIDTPVSSIRTFDKAKFRIDVFRDGDTDVSIFRGIAYVENRSGKKKVIAGQTLSLSENDAELLALGSYDEWEQWNRERDKGLEERRYSYKYLPDELEGYSNDFDDNGKWVYAREYGYVWTPTVVVSVGWSPYRLGRWVWIASDYVWISYEPWGWAPYHYGRWSFIASIGWCWVPPVRGAVYWGPGYVGWVSTPTYVAWVPLAPGETYYGYGYYGPNSVNIFNININKRVVKNVYKNVHINNAVSVIHNDTFVKGRHVDFKVKENPFLKEKISFGRPEIQPERATAMPLIKEIPRSKQPPQVIRDIRINEIKQERHLVKERSGSVLLPETPSKQMPTKRYQGTTKDGVTRTLEGIEPVPQRQMNTPEQSQKQEQKPAASSVPQPSPQRKQTSPAEMQQKPEMGARDSQREIRKSSGEIQTRQTDTTDSDPKIKGQDVKTNKKADNNREKDTEE